MKLEIERPTHLVDISRLPLDTIEDRRTAGCASARWSATPTSPPTSACARDYRCLSQALLAGASGQLRNKATIGGNLLQRTRCPYFYDTRSALQQARARQRAARRIGGLQPAATRSSARATPASPRIRRTWRSRWARSMRRIETVRPDGATRAIPIGDFHRLPGDTPHIETVLEPAS